jgi:light-independent protochlorophyllide reductase subunit N
VGSGTRLLLAQPFVSDTVQALCKRGAKLIPSLYPLGVQGTLAWFQAAAASGVPAESVSEALAIPVARAQKAVARVRENLKDRVSLSSQIPSSKSPRALFARRVWHVVAGGGHALISIKL